MTAEKPKYLILTAGGSGSRMGAAEPKQFLNLGGKAVMHLTMERFIAACPDIKVVTVLPESSIAFWKDYCLVRNLTHPQIIVAGGITRFHSVQNALSQVPDGAVVAVHDAVRPLLSVGMIKEMFARMPDCRALVPVLPPTDTLKAARADSKGEIRAIEGRRIDRSEVYCAQTPQMFRSEDIKMAYKQAFNTCFTDDSSVAEAAKIPLTYCLGERFNLKLTTPEDMVLAKAILLL